MSLRIRRRATLQGWWASLYVVSMPIWVSEGINCCNCYGPPVCSTTMSTRWSQLQSKVVAPELLLSLSSSCCPSGDLQGQPSLSPVCKDASPMSTVIAGPYWFCHCHQRWNLYLGELWLSYCQCDSFPKHLTSLLRCAVTKWKPLIRIHGWIQLRPRVWIQIRVLCRCGVIVPCLLLVVEGIFKWNPGKCAKSHHAILHTVTIPNRL